MSNILYAGIITVIFLLLVWVYERKLEAKDSQVEALKQRVTELSGRRQCGARFGEWTCTLEPHVTPHHLDETAGNRYRSATWREPVSQR